MEEKKKPKERKFVHIVRGKKAKPHGGRGTHLRGGFFPVEESDKIC